MHANCKVHVWNLCYINYHHYHHSLTFPLPCYPQATANRQQSYWITCDGLLHATDHSDNINPKTFTHLPYRHFPRAQISITNPKPQSCQNICKIASSSIAVPLNLPQHKYNLHLQCSFHSFFFSFLAFHPFILFCQNKLHWASNIVHHILLLEIWPRSCCAIFYRVSSNRALSTT